MHVIYYYPEWAVYDRNFPVETIPIEYVPEIAYAFVGLKEKNGFWVPFIVDTWAATDKRYTENGIQPFDTCQSNGYFGSFGQFRKLKEKGHKFLLGLSIGGWTFSAHFSDAVATAESRHAFVNELEHILCTFSIFDSVNIDWEYLSPYGKNYGMKGNKVGKEDAANFSMLLQLMRHRFGQKYKLSAAVTACPDKMDALPVEKMALLLDEFHVMTYDYASSAWGPTKAGHHSNLKKTSYTPYSVEESVNAYMQRGVPKQKICIGVAFYSRGFANTNGLGKPSNGVVSAKSWEEGVCDAKVLPPTGYTEYWDEEAKATYCYNPSTRELLSYDSPRSIRSKVEYVRNCGLGGIIVWELTGGNEALWKAFFE